MKNLIKILAFAGLTLLGASCGVYNNAFSPSEKYIQKQLGVSSSEAVFLPGRYWTSVKGKEILEKVIGLSRGTAKIKTKDNFYFIDGVSGDIYDPKNQNLIESYCFIGDIKRSDKLITEKEAINLLGHLMERLLEYQTNSQEVIFLESNDGGETYTRKNYLNE